MEYVLALAALAAVVYFVYRRVSAPSGATGTGGPREGNDENPR